ncbi:hypothetical protein FJZ18_03260 [Candidatus Pacearchaeota archaeon]|nr:hypothetical protein [Candidatus Pacearchaeota archaeon]
MTNDILVVDLKRRYQSMIKTRIDGRQQEIDKFERLNEIYNKTVENIGYCKQLALSDNFPAHATWLDPVTLARWLHGSVLEFGLEYHRESYSTGILSHEKNKLKSAWNGHIQALIIEAGQEILSKYPELEGKLT